VQLFAKSVKLKCNVLQRVSLSGSLRSYVDIQEFHESPRPILVNFDQTIKSSSSNPTHWYSFATKTLWSSHLLLKIVFEMPLYYHACTCFTPSIASEAFSLRDSWILNPFEAYSLADSWIPSGSRKLVLNPSEDTRFLISRSNRGMPELCHSHLDSPRCRDESLLV
jgi:hypothetical protein